MDSQAAQAVFVKSTVDDTLATAVKVRGPTLESTAAEAIDSLHAVGFQGTNFGKAAQVCDLLAADRTVGTSVLQTLANLEAKMTAEGASEEVIMDAVDALKKTLPPVTFLGVISTLLGTGVRDSVQFLCEHALVDVIVVSGGALEHDIRRAVGCEYKTVPSGNAQMGGLSSSTHTTTATTADETTTTSIDGKKYGRFGNVVYEKFNARFNTVMTAIIATITAECNAKKAHQLTTDKELLATANKRSERSPLDGLLPSWVMTPSEFWQRVGELLPNHLSEQEYKSSVAYWAAVNKIPIYCPSISDGDVMRYFFAEEEIASTTGAPSTAGSNNGVKAWPKRFQQSTATTNNISPQRLQLDLVKDIYLLNRTAMKAHHTGILICGGGVIKHHICNANLFRNGAEHAVYINNAQEYDGSDGGARPDEAISWGKIRATAKPVKIYAEITLVFPLLVAATYAQRVYASKHQQ